jgi:hypothetical protein
MKNLSHHTYLLCELETSLLMMGIQIREISKLGWPIGLVKHAIWVDSLYFLYLLLLSKLGFWKLKFWIVTWELLQGSRRVACYLRVARGFKENMMMEWYVTVEFLHIHCAFSLPDDPLFISDNAQFTQHFEEYIYSYVTLGSSHASALQKHNQPVSRESTLKFTYLCRFMLPTHLMFLTRILLHLPQTKHGSMVSHFQNTLRFY